MSKKEKTSFDAQKAQEEKDVKKKLKAAEQGKGKPAKDKKEQEKKAGGKNAWRAVKKFVKDFRGELKKIIWPDFKTVMKNTGIVLAVVLIIGAPVWLIDFGLTQSIKGLKTLAQGVAPETTEAAYEDETTAAALEALTTTEEEEGASGETSTEAEEESEVTTTTTRQTTTTTRTTTTTTTTQAPTEPETEPANAETEAQAEEEVTEPAQE